MATTKRGKKRQRHQKLSTVIHKKKWIEPVIYRVPLDSNQAVISCCSVLSKGRGTGTYSPIQCNVRFCGGTGSAAALS